MAGLPFFVPLKENEAQLGKEWLLLPAVTVGNVGQLTLDLLIYNLGLERQASLYHKSVLAVCGQDPYGSGNGAPELATGMDVYSKGHNVGVTVIQQRAPAAKGCQAMLAAAYHEWALSSSFGRVVLVTSLAPNHWRHVELLRTGQLCFLVAPHDKAEEDREELRRRRWVDLEQLLDDDADNVVRGGIGPELLRLAKESKLPLIVVVRVCSEGDNVADAMLCASEITSWLGLEKHLKYPDALSPPPSWQAFYGGPPESSLF